MNSQVRSLVLSSCLFFFSSCSCVAWFGADEEFISVRQMRFIHKGKPHYFAGANMWYGAYLGSTGTIGDRARLRRELNALDELGVDNLRILAASELSASRRSVKPAFQPSPGIVDDSLLAGLDFLLAEMAERDMHAVLYLSNYWEWSGGFTQYNIWTGGPVIDPDTTGHTWDEYMDYAATFYANQPAQELFRDYIKRIVTRVNTVNGRPYSKDPTIMAWQLANEPRPGTVGDWGESNVPNFNEWIHRTAAFIDSLDGNHLISTGSEGVIGSLLSEEHFFAAHRSPHIDYLTFHLWPHIWGWFDVKRPGESFDLTQIMTQEYIGQHIRLARLLAKPVVMDEFGLLRDSGLIGAGTPVEFRDRYYQFVYKVLEDSASAGGPIAGSNFWAWGGEVFSTRADGKWQIGDPFVGDPPQEPQGLNSVFGTDSTTLAIIRGHAAVMRELRAGTALDAFGK
ncbi:MAG: mannanase [Bacteroidota bacterium]